MLDWFISQTESSAHIIKSCICPYSSSPSGFLRTTVQALSPIIVDYIMRRLRVLVFVLAFALVFVLSFALAFALALAVALVFALALVVAVTVHDFVKGVITVDVTSLKHGHRSSCSSSG